MADTGGRRVGGGDAGLPGSHLLPGLRTLAQTQPVREGLGLGLGQASRRAANQTGTQRPPTSTPGHCQHTPGPGSLPTTHSRGRSGCSRARTARLADRTPTKHTEAQSRRCWSLLFGAVTEVAAPSQGLPSHAHEPARRALRGSWVLPSGVRSVAPVQPSPPPGRLVLARKAAAAVAVWTAHRRDKRRDSTQHCTERSKRKTRKPDPRAGRWTNLREGGVSPKQRNPGRKHTKCRGNRSSNSSKEGLLFFFFFPF